MYREGIMALTLVPGAAAAAAPPRLPGTMVPAATAAGVLRPRVLYSPDRQCAVRITHGEADVSSIQCLRVVGRKLVPVDGVKEDVHAMQWLPGKPHTLVFSASSVYSGFAGLCLWPGTGKVRVLTKTGRKEVEVYELLGASRDGRTLYYQYGWEDPHDYRRLHRELEKVRTLRLPPPGPARKQPAAPRGSR